jgi:hypothetical protein
MRNWDESSSHHLETLVASLEATGLTSLIEEWARFTFRTNLARHEPVELFDDSSTLGFVSSKNLTGRLMSILRKSGTGPLDGVVASMVDNTIEITFGQITLHIIKAPSSPRREPNWMSFTWSERPTRYFAARRNAQSYNAPHAESSIEPLFEDTDFPVTGLEGCTDVFLVWSGDETTGLTGGWLGLPTAGPATWLAVQRLWWDEIEPPKSTVDVPGDPVAPADGFLSREPATPIIGLKRDRATGTDS